MKLQRLAQILIATSVVLSTVLFGMGQRSVLLSVLMAAAAGLSLYFTDLREQWVLSRRASLLVAVAATAIAVTRTRADVHVQLVTLAILQAALQAVLLFSQKTPRVNWLLMLLALGQTIVASILNLGLTFGMMLLPFLGVCMATLAVLGLLSDERRADGDVSSGRLDGGDRLDRSARTSSSAGAAALTRPSGPRSAGLRMVGPIELIGAVAPRPAGFWRGLVRQVTFVAAASLAVTAALFFLLPRSDGENWDGGLTAPLRIVGFSPEVDLGDLGEAMESSEVVMRVRFTDGQTGRPYGIKGEPLFRGTALTQYDSGRWERRYRDDQNPIVLFPRDELPASYVTQELTLEPLDDATVFPVFPSFAAARDTRLQHYPRGGELVRPDLSGQATTFQLATTTIRDHRLLDVVPATEPIGSFEQALLLLPFGVEPELAEPLRPIQAAATQVLAEAGIEASNRIAAARRLSEHLRATGGFQYSVAPQIRDRSLDPLVEFVTRSRRGHCEYFAGALALMLRSQGIPCRLAIGFKGGEWNALGGYYQVMQLHAHAWVEAYLGPEECAGEPLADEIRRAGGGWLVLDPTAEIGDQSSWLRRGLFGGALATADFAQVLWSRYVVGLDMRRQQESIYRPLRTAAQELAKSLTDKRTWRARLRGDWFDWKSGLVAIAGLTAIALAVRGLRRLALRWRPWWQKLAAPVRLARSPGFALYRRLETALGRSGCRRGPGQTPQEFCETALAALAGRDATSAALSKRWRGLAERVVAEFYRARYGQQALAPERLAELSREFAELEASAELKRATHGGRIATPGR